MHTPAIKLAGLLLLIGACASTAQAVPTIINGSGSSTGINAGFGNAFGTQSNLAITSDAVGNVDWLLTTGSNNLDNANAVVIYIDTDEGATGFDDTSLFNDAGSPTLFDELRAAVSGYNGTNAPGGAAENRSQVTFAPEFKANYALALNAGLALAFRLDAAGHEFIDTITGDGFGEGGPYEFAHTFGDLGLGADDSFRYVGTYLDPIGMFRSDEFHGVATASVPAGNIGFGDVTLSAGDYNTFISGETSPFVDGDTDNDMVVEFEDDFFPIRDNWLETQSSMPGLARTDGDLNIDGSVDIIDFREWKDAYNPNPQELHYALSSLGMAAPEPGSFAIAVFAAALLGAARLRPVS